jgi:hypothetical protein
MENAWYLVMVIAVFSGFGLVLGFVSWEETRMRKKRVAAAKVSVPGKSPARSEAFAK